MITSHDVYESYLRGSRDATIISAIPYNLLINPHDVPRLFKRSHLEITNPELEVARRLVAGNAENSWLAALQRSLGLSQSRQSTEVQRLDARDAKRLTVRAETAAARPGQSDPGIKAFASGLELLQQRDGIRQLVSRAGNLVLAHQAKGDWQLAIDEMIAGQDMVDAHLEVQSMKLLVEEGGRYEATVRVGLAVARLLPQETLAS